MDFYNQIKEYEDNKNVYSYIMKTGKVPLMLTAVHTVSQEREEGTKPSEPLTAAICQYVGNAVSASFLIKAIDNGVDSNDVEEDEFKEVLLKKIKDNDIKVLIDIHGAKKDHPFDVELGTLCNLSADITTCNTLVDCFKEQGVTEISINDPFKGGGISQYIYANTNIDIIQIEINRNYRNLDDWEKCKKVCDALIEFAKKYSNFV